MSDVTVTLGADATAFMNSMQEMQADVRKVMSGIEKSVHKLSDSSVSKLARFGQAFMGLKSVAQTVIGTVTDIAQGLVNLTKGAAVMTDLRNSMTALSGDAAATAAALKELEAWGPKHGIDDEGLARNAESMMKAGMSLKDAMRNTKNMAIISAGDEKTSGLLTQQVAKAQAGEGMTSRDLKAFEREGIDLRSALADVLGVAREEVADLVKEAVPVDTLTEALGELAKPGGKLAQRFDAYDQGFESSLSRLSLTWGQCMDEIGGAIEGGMTDANNSISDMLLQHRVFFAKIGDWVAGILKDLPRMLEFLSDVAEAIKKPFVWWWDWVQTNLRYLIALFSTLSFSDAYDQTKDFNAHKQREREAQARRDAERQQQFDENDRRGREKAESGMGSGVFGKMFARVNFGVNRANSAASKAEKEQARKAKKEAEEQERKVLELRKKFEDKEKAYMEAREKDAWALKSNAEKREALENATSNYGIDFSGGQVKERITAEIDATLALPNFNDPVYQKKISDLQQLREQWANYEKEKEKYFRREEARQNELAALRAEVEGNEDAAQKLREEAQMREKVNSLIEEGVDKRQAEAEVADEFALKKQLEERRERKARASQLQGMVNQSLVDVGGAQGRGFELSSNLLDQGKRQTQLQTTMATLLAEIRDNTGGTPSAVLA